MCSTSTPRASFRSALATADSNSSVSNTINLTTSITLTDTTAGELSVNNTTGQGKTLIIEGTGTTPEQTLLSGSTTLNTGVLKIGSGVSGSVTVIVQNLTITGGQAHGGGGGILGDSAAQGGGVSITGGKVTLSKVVIQGNNAIGANGNDGAAGANGSGVTPPKPGANGTNGGPRRGGGIYVRGGTLTLTNTVVQYNVAQGGRGGNGGAGGKGVAPGQNGAAGGNGGNGGVATGAGIYVAGGELVMISSNAHPPGYTGLYQVAVQLNGAVGGNGGNAGSGGNGAQAKVDQPAATAGA